MTSRKKPGMAFWATVALVWVLVGYLLSIGPVYSITMKYWGDIPEWGTGVLGWYCYPLQWVVDSGPGWLYGPVMRYVAIWL